MKYFIQRILRTIPILIGVTFLTFTLLYFSPTDPAEMHFHQAGAPATAEMLTEFRVLHHLEEPFLIRYGSWWKDFFAGNMGISYQDGIHVSDKIVKAAPYTIAMAVNSMLMTIIVSLPIGIFCAYRRESIPAKIINMIVQIGLSVPNFVIALLLLYLFTSVFDIFAVIPKNPIIGVIMPSLSIMIGMSFRYIKQIRQIIGMELEKDYMKGLRARGVPAIFILVRTVLRNSMIELITLIAVSFGSLLSGVALIESIFNWPGLGKLLIDAVISKDIPLIQGIVVWLAIAYIAINLFADLLYGLFDPRIRLAGDYNAHKA